MDTTTISDALDKLGIAGQCLGIAPLDPTFRMAGPAFTVRYVPCGVHGGTVGDYIDDLPEGTVVTLDNQQRVDATVWGGTVIDGVCRDAPRAIEMRYPIFSRGTYMRTGKDRVAVDAVQCSVSIGGVRVNPGDLLVGDRDGVVAVPKERFEQIAEVAQRIDEAENRIREAIERGERLDEVRKTQQYHSLQTRDRS
jgi:regulator of RNase E activity RraA